MIQLAQSFQPDDFGSSSDDDSDEDDSSGWLATSTFVTGAANVSDPAPLNNGIEVWNEYYIPFNLLSSTS